mgnify:CR=1 FL=1
MSTDDRTQATSTPPADYSRHVIYPFPLRDGLMGYLNLPTDLSREEADRLVAYIVTLTAGEVTARFAG